MDEVIRDIDCLDVTEVAADVDETEGSDRADVDDDMTLEPTELARAEEGAN